MKAIIAVVLLTVTSGLSLGALAYDCDSGLTALNSSMLANARSKTLMEKSAALKLDRIHGIANGTYPPKTLFAFEDAYNEFSKRSAIESAKLNTSLKQYIANNCVKSG